jgi:acyl-CoA thioesterase I
MRTKWFARPVLAGAMMAVSLIACSGVQQPQLHPANPNAPIQEAEYSGRIKVACVGDSITQGVGTKAPAGASNAYPEQLQRLLGEKYEIGNFGITGCTLLKKGDKPYWKQKAFEKSKAFLPDVVVLMLGTNDTKAQNWMFIEEFSADYQEMVGQYQALESNPRIFVCRPCVVLGAGNYRITEANLLRVIPMIDDVVRELSLGVIDIHAATVGHDKMIPDRVHPNNEGANLLAQTVYQALKGKPPENASKVILTPPASRPATATAPALH